MWKTISYTSLVSSRAQTYLNLAKTSHRIIACNLSISTNRSLLINIPKFSGTTTTLLSHQIRRTNGSASQQPDLKTPLNNAKSTNTTTQAPKRRDFIRFLAIFASGVIAYFAISYSLDARSNAHKTDAHINYSSPNLPGKIKPSKSIIREKNPGGIKITLYQYVTCPFCCKVRAYLDYYGYSYEIVEVNSINKKQIDWSSYKKVPILAVQTPSAEEPDKYNDTIMQLNDSTVIISSLETYRLGPNKPLNEITTYYEPLEIEGEKGRRDYINKYFVMLYNQAMNDNKDVSERRAERDWREWVDKKFIHAISPNVYRTMSESLEAFDWFKVAGDWEKQFNTFELISIHYIGAIVMYIIGKRLKKKHELKDDVRQSMYEYCNEWVESLNGKFKGGNRPNLADLALYGAIGSFKGCTTFDDIMNNSKIRSWYEACGEEVENSRGKDLLHQTSGKNRPFTSSYPETTKKSKRFGIF